MLVDKCDKLQEAQKEKEDRINKLTSDLRYEQIRAQQLEQHAEESGMLEDEYKRLKDEKSKALIFEVKRARQQAEKRVQEREIFVEECDKLHNEVKEKKERINKLASGQEDARKRMQ